MKIMYCSNELFVAFMMTQSFEPMHLSMRASGKI